MKQKEKQPKEKTMIEVYRDDHKNIMLFKLHTNAKNVPETIALIIKKLKKELK